MGKKPVTREENRQVSLSGLIGELCRQYGEAKVRDQLEALKGHGDAVEDPVLWLCTALSHNFKFMPIEQVSQCPCGSRESNLLCRFVFWNLLGIRQCRNCGLIYVSPRLTKETMARVFKEFYFDYSDPEYWGSRRVPIFRDIMRLLRRYKCKSAFDVGTAFGQFVAWATKAGIHAAGCDISEKAVLWGRANLGVNLHHGTITEVHLAERSFDSVVSLDTFYYVSDPLAELRAMRRLVRPGGYVILRLRNGLRTLARARREGNKAIGKSVMPSQHLWAFTPQTIGHLFQLCNLEILTYEPASYSRSPWTPFQVLNLQANRFLARLFLKWPIHTQSFNVIAKRNSN